MEGVLAKGKSIKNALYFSGGSSNKSISSISLSVRSSFIRQSKLLTGPEKSENENVEGKIPNTTGKKTERKVK